MQSYSLSSLRLPLAPIIILKIKKWTFSIAWDSESQLRWVDTRKMSTEVNIKFPPGYNKPWIGPKPGLRMSLFSGIDMNIPKLLTPMSCSLDCPGDLNFCEIIFQTKNTGTRNELWQLPAVVKAEQYQWLILSNVKLLWELIGIVSDLMKTINSSTQYFVISIHILLAFKNT